MATGDKYKTDQEAFWAGDFGTGYIQRNQGEKLLASNLAFFVKALSHAGHIESCIEFGANVGMNLKALKLLFPGIEAHGVEINAEAVRSLAQVIPQSHITHGSILDFDAATQVDLALIKGVLIHINPDALSDVYQKIVKSTKRYLMVAEYYSPVPVAILYRGHTDRLFKRDFAGEILAQHSEMRLVDYGFAYRGDPSFPQDDITWFLLEKTR